MADERCTFSHPVNSCRAVSKVLEYRLKTGLQVHRTSRPKPLVCYAVDPSVLPDALLFDCDGVLVDTEKDGHRVSFNMAFKEKGLTSVWGVEEYGDLVKIGGGKERMTK